jgi:geranyl-CoA carboxylase alpha subunit
MTPHVPRLRHILIANRGEIAWRILRTAHARGYEVSCVYSEADAHAPYLPLADHALCIGPAALNASYRNPQAILAAARAIGADSIHPGYGLLSENADFADAVRTAGFRFIGPSGDAIRSLGDKRGARVRARELGVPCVPGYDGEDQSDATLHREAAAIGFPLMVTAAAGGGGRGMRRVTRAQELGEALARARSEALQSFADGRLILERAVDHARHVEVQIFADQHGNVVHLGERDCSLQRRFQKLVEEAPSPAVDPALRARLGAAAVKLAGSANYEGAGTVEMLLAPDRQFYFLEMNTRLQVEHPVTECVTGIDLVDLQFRIAEGEALGFEQAEVALRGHAIEARLYAEKPAQGFLPATGTILRLALPERVRVDHALAPGIVIGSHYDAMLAKVIACADTRERARQRLMAALEQLQLLGVATNQAYLRELIGGETFARGASTTDFIDSGPIQTVAPDERVWACAAALFVLRGQSGDFPAELRGFSNGAGVAALLTLEYGSERRRLRVATRGAYIVVTRDGAETALEVVSQAAGQLELLVPQKGASARERLAYALTGDALHLQLGSRVYTFSDRSFEPRLRASAAGSGNALAPMDGNLLAVLAKPGDSVEAGQTLAVVEAMKLELRVAADRPGIVARVHAQAGAQVKAGQLLVELVELVEQAEQAEFV